MPCIPRTRSEVRTSPSPERKARAILRHERVTRILLYPVQAAHDTPPVRAHDVLTLAKPKHIGPMYNH